jgi:two-component system sensor histidine kinase YesM
MKRSNDLRRKLVWFSIAVVMIPMIILYVMILTFFTNRSIAENERYAYHNIQSVSSALDSAFSGLNELSLFILSNRAVRNYLTDPFYSALYAQVNSSLQLLPFSSKYYKTASVISDTRELLYSGIFTNKNITPSDRARAEELMGTSFWSIRPGDVSLIRLMRDIDRLNRALGYIKIEVNQAALLEIMAAPDSLPRSSYFLMTDVGVMLSRGEIPEGLLKNEAFSFEALSGGKRDSAAISLNGHSYSYSTRPVFEGKVVVVSILDRAALFQFDSLLVWSIAAALLMSALFSSILIKYYTRRVFDPLNRLGEVMAGVEARNFDSDYVIPGNNEITRLVGQFNLMCGRLKLMHEQVYLSEIRQRDAELHALQSEINPHFLYNTLDTIYWMSEISHTWKVSEMVKSLSNLFRIALAPAPDGLVPLKLEKEYIECYLTIQQVRYQDQIRFEFYVQDGLDELPVLKLLLQPIVENAIIHGVEPAGGGRVVINIYLEDDALVYKVFNEGRSVDEKEMEELMREERPGTRGLAVRNVSARLKLRFGSGYAPSFENVPGGVLVTIRQPASGEMRGEGA